MIAPEALILVNEDTGGLDSVPAVITDGGRSSLPPILDGYSTVSVEEKVRRFVLNLPEMLERWISRRSSPHTQRAYRQDLFTFIGFANLGWPQDATRLFAVTVGQVHDYRDWLTALLSSGVRLGTLLRLDMEDFHSDQDDPPLRITEKGNRRRTIGLNVQAAQAMRDYIEKAGLTHGPLFRSRFDSRTQRLGEGR